MESGSHRIVREKNKINCIWDKKSSEVQGLAKFYQDLKQLYIGGGLTVDIHIKNLQNLMETNIQI